MAPLNTAAQQALADLLQAQTIKKRDLIVHLSSATEKLTAVAGQLNDRGTEERLRYAKKQARLDGDGGGGDEGHGHLSFQGKVDALTRSMDISIRAVIDDQVWVGGVPDILRHVATKSGALAEATQLQTQGPTQIYTQRSGGQTEPELEDEGACRLTVPPLDPSETPTALLHSAFEKASKDWSSKSLTECYVKTNEYIGFYRTVYDAKNGDNAPPVPHSSLWFADEEDPDPMPGTVSQSKKGRHAEQDDDSDIEIASERISTKCPITFLTFRDPVTSMKCPHSFEKGAILEMLHHSSKSLPFTAEQVIELSQYTNRREKERREREFRIRAVDCPVCSLLLTESDLNADPVLLRKVRRIEAAAKRQESTSGDIDDEEDEDENDDAPRGSQRKPVGLGSSPPRRLSGRAEIIKMERAGSRSIRPQTQLPSGTRTTMTAGGATVVDLSEDEDGEDMTEG